MGQTRKKNWRKRGMVLDIDMAALRAANQAADEDQEDDEPEAEDQEASPSPERVVQTESSNISAAPAPSSVSVLTQEKPDVSMWKMVEDASGKPYYWNQDDNSTSWTPPVGWDLSNAHNNNGSSNSNETSLGDQEDNTELTDESDDHMNAWGTSVDPNSGKEYYWNKVTGETSWELPTVSNLSLPTTASSIASDPSPAVPSSTTSILPASTTPATTESAEKVTKEVLKSPKKEHKQGHRRDKSGSRPRSRTRSRSVSSAEEKDRSRSNSGSRKKEKKKKHHHKKKEKDKSRTRKKDSKDSDSGQEKDRREQKKNQEKDDREKRKKREREKLEQQREKEREEGLREAEEKATETRTKTIVSALSIGIQARVSSLSKIIGLLDRKILPLDKFQVELEIRISDWKEGATTSAWTLGKLQVLAGQLDGIIAEEKEALRESERRKQEEDEQAARDAEARDLHRAVEKRKKRALNEATQEHTVGFNRPASEEAVYAPFGSSGKVVTAKPDIVTAPPIHPSRLVLIAQAESASSRIRSAPPLSKATSSHTFLGPALPPSMSGADESAEEEEESEEEEIDGVPVTVHHRRSKKSASTSGNSENKKKSTKQVFGKQMGDLVDKWTKVQKEVGKEAKRLDEEAAITGRRTWRPDVEASQASNNANFVEIGKRSSLSKRRRDEELVK